MVSGGDKDVLAPRRLRLPRLVNADLRLTPQFGSRDGDRTRLTLQLLLYQGLEVIAAQLAIRVGLAVDESSLGSQHLRRLTPVFGIAPPEI
jgi:hypothetical protein